MKRFAALLVGTLIAFAGQAAHGFHDTKEALAAVVGVRAEVPRDAYTARTLGVERMGSGVVIGEDGLILTIGYLVLEAEHIEVAGPGGRVTTATFVGYDGESGFGLIRADEPLGIEPIRLGRSADLPQGEDLVVASYGGLFQAVVLVARSEFAGGWEYLLEDALYTTPPHTNFAGAALLNSESELVGIGSVFVQVSHPTLGAVPCNVFVPADLLEPVLDDLVATGASQAPPDPWLGFTLLEAQGRVFVNGIAKGGPAEEAGLRLGDIILTVDGDPVSGIADLYRKVRAIGDAGVNVRMTVLQGAQARRVTVHSADRSKFLKTPRKKSKGAPA